MPRAEKYPGIQSSRERGREPGGEPYVFTEVPGGEGIIVTLGGSAKTFHQEMGLFAHKYRIDKGNDAHNRFVVCGQDAAAAEIYPNNFNNFETRVIACAVVSDGVSLDETSKPSGKYGQLVAESTARAGIEVGEKLAMANKINPQIIQLELSDAVRGLGNRFNSQGIYEGDCTALFAVITYDPEHEEIELYFAGAGDPQIIITYFNPETREVVVEKLFDPHVNPRRKSELTSSARQPSNICAKRVKLTPYIKGKEDVMVIACSDYLGEKIPLEVLAEMIQPQHSPDKLLGIRRKRPSPFNALSRGVASVLEGSIRRKRGLGSKSGARYLAEKLAGLDVDDGSFVAMSLTSNLLRSNLRF
jgi:hypothetical protein